MKFLASHENSQRGSEDFPLELYHVDSSHPRYQMAFHWHMECEIIRILQGTFALSLDDKKILLTEGQSQFIPSGVIHGGTPDNCVYQCIVFSAERMLPGIPKRLEEYERGLGQGDYLPMAKRYNTLTDQLFTAVRSRTYGCEFVAQGMILQMFGEIMAEKNRANPPGQTTAHIRQIQKMKEVLRQIRQDYDKPLTLETLAKTAGLNHQYLCKSFKHMTGKTPIDYLNFYRIECSAELLQLGEMNVTEIAYACGFNDLSYYIKLFKRQKGISPGAYQKGHG